MSAIRGFLLMNTGSPDAPTEEAVHTFIREYTADPYVNKLPDKIREPLVHWIIHTHHPAEAAAAYASIWTDNGSPLIHACASLAEQLRERVQDPVEVGMAHGNPSFHTALKHLLEQDVNEICLLPMFPQYDITTAGACIDAIYRELAQREYKDTLRVAPPFYQESTYLEPLAEALNDTNDHVLFVFHGLSTHNVKRSDPTHFHCLSAPTCCSEASLAHDTCYRFQCLTTSRTIARMAGIPNDRYSVSFQSRHDHGKWLEPHMDAQLQKLPTKGKKRLTAICPSFFCDGLETLEEVGIRGRNLFMGAGGESFRRIPGLNDSPQAVRCLETVMSRTEYWEKK